MIRKCKNSSNPSKELVHQYAGGTPGGTNFKRWIDEFAGHGCYASWY